MKNKNLIFLLLAIGAGAFFLMKKRQTQTDEVENSGGGFELPPEYTTSTPTEAPTEKQQINELQLTFSEPVSSFINPAATNIKAPTSTTETPQNVSELNALADIVRANYNRWNLLINTPIINGTIDSKYNIIPGNAQLNPIYNNKISRNSLNLPLPNIALIPNIMAWGWDAINKTWSIIERTA